MYWSGDLAHYILAGCPPIPLWQKAWNSTLPGVWAAIQGIPEYEEVGRSAASSSCNPETWWPWVRERRAEEKHSSLLILQVLQRPPWQGSTSRGERATELELDRPLHRPLAPPLPPRLRQQRRRPQAAAAQASRPLRHVPLRLGPSWGRDRKHPSCQPTRPSSSRSCAEGTVGWRGLVPWTDLKEGCWGAACEGDDDDKWWWWWWW